MLMTLPTKHTLHLLGLLAAVTLPTPVLAQDEPAWSGQFSFGLSSLVGNTNTGSVNADLAMRYDTQQALTHNVDASIYYSDRSSGRGFDRVESRNAKSLDYRAEYALNKHSTLIGFTSYEDDNIAKLEAQTMIGGGYSRQLFKSKRQRLSGALGVGMLGVNYTDRTPIFDGAVGRAFLAYRGKITDKISLNESLLVLGSDNSTTTRLKTSLQYAVSETVSIALKNQVVHNTHAPLTAKDKTDSVTSMNLVIDF
ncbi:MAG: hypothetical protein BWK73_40020 [Thiothrix lacustris]|uniref:Salt-induced outer membrane protein n=1 Tax=Thiothrix lacustris TaxID=525917 RepID=A0A1Y1QDI6_9GAMM|nr:MAG: hypothetical protein BWK73_40020 [Thiothrix lacustris]